MGSNGVTPSWEVNAGTSAERSVGYNGVCGDKPRDGFRFCGGFVVFYEDIGYRKIDEPCEVCLLVAAVPSCNLRDGDCVMRWGLV